MYHSRTAQCFKGYQSPIDWQPRSFDCGKPVLLRSRTTLRAISDCTHLIFDDNYAARSPQTNRRQSDRNRADRKPAVRRNFGVAVGAGQLGACIEVDFEVRQSQSSAARQRRVRRPGPRRNQLAAVRTRPARTQTQAAVRWLSCTWRRAWVDAHSRRCSSCSDSSQRQVAWAGKRRGSVWGVSRLADMLEARQTIANLRRRRTEARMNCSSDKFFNLFDSISWFDYLTITIIYTLFNILLK